MKAIENTFIWKLLEKIMRYLLIIAGALLIIIMGISVFMRYVMNSTLFGSEEILALLAIWLYWIGGAYGSYEDSHISADMTDLLIRNEKFRAKYKIFIRGLTVVICGVFAYWGVFKYGVLIVNQGARTTGLHIPLVTSRIALSIAFVLMFFYSIYHFVRSLHPLETEKGEAETL